MASQQNRNSCRTCRFWSPTPVVLFGECRRYAPGPIATNEGIRAYFPLTARGAWCGEWSISPNAQLPRVIVG